MADNSKKAKDAALADGAAEIKNAMAEVAVVPKAEPLKQLKLNEQEVADLIRDRVDLKPNHIGLEIKPETTAEEAVVVLKWTTQLHEHVGFMIGDALNFIEAKHGTKYAAAQLATGLALSTLKGFAETAKRIPWAKRIASLPFSHHREALRAIEDTKIEAVLKEAAAETKKAGGKPPSSKDVRYKAIKVAPRKKAKPTKPTSGKGKKGKGKAKPEPTPYEPTKEEAGILEECEAALDNTADMIKEDGLFAILKKCEMSERKKWLNTFLPYSKFWTEICKINGK